MTLEKSQEDVEMNRRIAFTCMLLKVILICVCGALGLWQAVFMSPVCLERKHIFTVAIASVMVHRACGDLGF